MSPAEFILLAFELKVVLISITFTASEPALISAHVMARARFPFRSVSGKLTCVVSGMVSSVVSRIVSSVASSVESVVTLVDVFKLKFRLVSLFRVLFLIQFAQLKQVDHLDAF